jgi:transposase
MMGERRVMQEALFYGFSLDRHVPDSHLLRKIDRFVDLSGLRAHLGPYYSDVGRPSIDPELMIRMLIVGYCFGIRSERRLCDEVHLNLAYRWFCRLGLDGDVPDHSTFSKNRHGRFRESDLLRKLFETVVARCMKEGIVGGEAFAVDASIIVADAHRRRGVAKIEDLDPTSNRAVAEYLSVLDDAGRAEGDLADRSGRPLHRFGQLSRRLCLFRQLSHRSEACGDHGRRGDDDHSPGRSRRGQDDARSHV